MLMGVILAITTLMGNKFLHVYAKAQVSIRETLTYVPPPQPEIRPIPAMLEDAGPEHLAFVASLKYFDAGGQSRAGCLIAPPEFPGDGARTIIQSPQPRAHFAQALMLLYPVRKVRPGVHPSACIEEGAHIDHSAEIGPFVTIGAGARVGARTRIGAGGVVEANEFILSAGVYGSPAILMRSGIGPAGATDGPPPFR